MTTIDRIDASGGVEPLIAALESDGVGVVAGALTPKQLSRISTLTWTT